MSKTVAITGATGFIGRHLCTKLGAAGHSVVAISRQESPTKSAPPSVAWRQVKDLTDPDLVADALDGVDVIVHLADSPERLQSAEVAPAARARAISAAAETAGVGNVLYASSVYARTAKTGTGGAYGALKRANEEAFLETRNLCSVVLRLPPVYGAGAKGGFAVLLGLVRRGLPVPFGRADALRDYISVGNLADLVCEMVGAPQERWREHSGNIYEPSDGQAISTDSLVRQLKSVTGSKSRIINAPRWMLMLAGRATGKGDAISAIFEPLLVDPQPSLKADWEWSAPEQVPATLSFLRT